MPTEVKKENLDVPTPGEMPPPFVFTDAAAKKVKSLIEEENNPNLKLRVYVQGGDAQVSNTDLRLMKLKMKTMLRWSV